MSDAQAIEHVDGMGIDEFARRCDTTVRMVREYQTLGVLFAPHKVGRNAVYDEDHLARWRAIGHLQERGYSLAAIADLFKAWETGANLSAILGVRADATLGALDETPALVDAAELDAQLPAVFNKPALLRRALRAGLVHRQGEDRYAVRSPALVQLVSDAIAAGIPAKDALGVVEAIDTHTRAISAATIDTLLPRLLDPAGGADVDLLRRGRPLLAQAVASSLINHIGSALLATAAERPDVAALVDELRVGAVNDMTANPTPDPKSRRP